MAAQARCSTYIGRVGALAVALGIGSAIATGHGLGLSVAYADDDTSPDTSEGTNTGTGTTGTDTNTTPTAATTDPDTPAGPVRTRPQRPRLFDVPGMILDATGGARVSGSDADKPRSTIKNPVVSNNSVITRRKARTTPEPAEVTTFAETTPTAKVLDHATPLTSTQRTLRRLAAPIDLPSPTTTVDRKPVAGQQQMLGVVQTAAVEKPRDALAALPGARLTVAARMVAAALAPFATPNPTTPPDPPALLGVLAWARREIHRTFFNQAPVAVADTATTTASTTAGTPVVIDVLANDTDSDTPKTALKVTGYSTPTNGTVAVNAAGKLVYTPKAGYTGTDTFTYTVSDATSQPHIHGLLGFLRPDAGHTATGTVTVTVEAANQAPVAGDATYEVRVGTPREIHLTDVATDPDGDPLRFPSLAIGVYTLTIDEGATISGPYNLGNGTIEFPDNSGDFGTFSYTPTTVGSHSFTYTVTDGELTSTGTITIVAINDAPVVTNEGYGTNENTPLTAGPAQSVLANDTDPEGDIFTATVKTQPTKGTVALNPDGTFTYTYTGANLALGEPTTDSFTYVATDSRGAVSTPGIVTIIVTGDNDPPVVGNEGYQTDENVTLTIPLAQSVLKNDTDAEGDTFTATVKTQPTKGTVTLDPDGTFTYPSTGANIPLGQQVTDTFTYTATDSNGNDSKPGVVTITVSGVNDPPVVGVGTVVTPENAAVSARVTATDPDGDTLTYALASAPRRGTISGIDFATTGGYTYTYTGANLADQQRAFDTFTYTATDSHGVTRTGTINITITGVNSAPVANPDPTFTVNEDSALAFSNAQLVGNDTDADGDVLTAVAASDPLHGSVINNGGTLTYVPDHDYNGPDSFTYAASDGITQSAPVTVNITVVAVPDIPRTVPQAVSVRVNTAVPISLLSYSSDPDGDPLAFPTVVVHTPDGDITVSLDRTQVTTAPIIDDRPSGRLAIPAGVMDVRTFTYTPKIAGTTTITYTVTDNQFETTGTITVIASNLPPSGGGGDDLPDDPGGGGGVRQ